MSPQVDHYAILSVSRRATPAELRRAYRSLVVRCHPDRHPGDPDMEERFKQIQEAYQTLSDPDRKARYDLSHPLPRMGDPDPVPRSTDVTVSLRLSVAECVSGTETEIAVPVWVGCDRRSIRGQHDAKCRHCRGEGRVQVMRRLRLAIPAGARPGCRIKLAGQGHAHPRAAGVGDLWVVIENSAKPISRRI